jgi:hypothetical protein
MNKTKRTTKRTTKRKTKRKTAKYGGKKREETIVVEFRKNYTNPNATSTIRVLKPPTEMLSDLGGFISAYTDQVDEELASIKKGREETKKRPYHREVIYLIYDDKNIPPRIYESPITGDLKPCQKRKLCTRKERPC